MAIVFGESRAFRPDRPRALARLALLPAQWHRLALGMVLLASAALEFIGLTNEQYANTYYAAAVKSMLTSWHNFFFMTSDAGGFVSVDKPPLGLWIETISAKLFGFNSLSLPTPEALAGVLSVALLYRLIARPFGPVAGLTAALALAVTPVNAVTDRNNTIDSLLILTLLVGAWAVLRAAETGKLRWLLPAALILTAWLQVRTVEAFPGYASWLNPDSHPYRGRGAGARRPPLAPPGKDVARSSAWRDALHRSWRKRTRRCRLVDRPFRVDRDFGGEW